MTVHSSSRTEQPSHSDHHEFRRAAALLHARAGIVVGEHKQDTVIRALKRETERLELGSAAEYLDYLQQQPQSAYWQEFINAFTINHTAFFRESHHFKTLADFVLQRNSPLSIWTCAASTGEEAYSIAITLQESVEQASSRCSVWATDIDTEAIRRAQEGIYSIERVQSIPQNVLKKYFYRGKGARHGLVRVKPILHDMISFEVLNLLDPTWPVPQKFDAIFCRNTLIYFDKQTQVRVLERLALMLNDGGLLFVGHSENFTYLTQSLRLRGQTVYERVSP